MPDPIAFDAATRTHYPLCPHCGAMCQIPESEIRCTIFRHANWKAGMGFVPPHASQAECERWLREGLVYGCARPFKFDGKTIVKCGYI